MGLNQILSMVMRLVMRKGMNWGLSKGRQMLQQRQKGGLGRSPAPISRDLAKHARDLGLMIGRNRR